jgi:SMC interacting uncharacterized protein involved in chromosome segregation
MKGLLIKKIKERMEKWEQERQILDGKVRQLKEWHVKYNILIFNWKFKGEEYFHTLEVKMKVLRQ